MFTVHGTFDLREGVTASEFAGAFDTLCRHLREQSFLVEWRLAERSPHPSYDRHPPQTRHYMSMRFPDAEKMEGCYEYVARDHEPLRSLHIAIKTRILLGSQTFFMMRNIPLLPDSAETLPALRHRHDREVDGDRGRADDVDCRQ